jgi:hypothetical protein
MRRELVIPNQLISDNEIVTSSERPKAYRRHWSRRLFAGGLGMELGDNVGIRENRNPWNFPAMGP